MNFMKLDLFACANIGMLVLGFFINTNQAANAGNKPDVNFSKTIAKTELVSQHPGSNQGGQVVESGKYHLEFVPQPEANGTHMDLFLQTGNNHEAIPNAKVTAQVQMPDGTQKTLPLKYDTKGKHYTALLAGKASGQYQVKINADIKGEKVSGRFSFKR